MAVTGMNPVTSDVSALPHAGRPRWLYALLGFCVFYRMLDVDSCHDHGGTYHSGEDPFDGRGGD